MSKTNGWIRLYRQLTENEIWLSEPFTRGQAWVDLLLLANHETTTGIDHRKRAVTYEEGKVYHSIVELSQRWQWSRGRTGRFLKMLEKCAMIRTQSDTTNGTSISIINWKKFQSFEKTDRQQSNKRAGDGATDGATDGAYTRSIRNIRNKEERPAEVKTSPSDIERIAEIPAGYRERFGDDIEAFREYMRGLTNEQLHNDA